MIRVGEKVGKFYINSAKAIISDPCYYSGSSNSKELSVFSGKWNAYVAYGDDERIENLVVVNDEYDRHIFLNHSKFNQLTDLPVDSGQMAVCDCDKFSHSESEYEKYCAQSLTKEGVGVVGNYAVVSSTGYGDGVYPLYGASIGDNYYAFMIEFIPEDEEGTTW